LKRPSILKIDGQFYRKNEIWRESELITKNFARVTYNPDNYLEETNYAGEKEKWLVTVSWR
jgi:vancomycin resistance protein VanW